MIRCTCGHEVEDFKDTKALSLADFDEHNKRCVSHVVYCIQCAENSIEEGYALLDKEDENDWLSSNHNMKCRYSTNWMGPVSIKWYSDRGLTKLETITLTRNSISVKNGTYKAGDQITVERITEHYSCGRIDVRGGETDPAYGDEINVPPMRSEDWGTFGLWLETFETDFMWTLDQLVKMYERVNPKIRWADGITF